MRKVLSILLSVATLLVLASCGGTGSDTSGADTSVAAKTTLTFADPGWDSAKLNNALAGLVAEKVFGYTWQETPGSTPISHESIIKGDVDIHMEEWTQLIPTYAADLKAGKFTELGVNFDDNRQGLYIPKYVADEYPDLKTVKDLAKHADLFPDPDDKSKGIIYGGVTGWAATEITKNKVTAYGLDQYYNFVESGSDAVHAGTMTSAWDKKEPIVAYYFEPTWLLGKYDFVLLEDDPYNEDTYLDGVGAFPAVPVTVAVSNDFAASNPDYCAFLKNFHMSTATINEALAYMNDTGADYNACAKWLLTETHPELIDEWLTSEQAETLRAAL